MQINYLPAGGAVGEVEIEVSPVTLYTKQRSSHKRCFIRHYMQNYMKMTSNIFWRLLFPSEIQWYKNTSNVFVFCNTQCSPHSPTILISIGGIYFNNILMGRFVKSQTPENNAKVQMSHSL